MTSYIQEKKKLYSRAAIHKLHINRGRKKEKRKELNERKRKPTENNVECVHGICVGNSLGNLR